MQKESEFQSLFSKWLRDEVSAGRHLESFGYELKLCKKPSINFTSDFQPQQIEYLWRTKHGCVRKKFSDADPTLKMYDGFQMCFAQAYVIIMFHKPRQPKIMHWIDVDDWISLIKTCGRKSATEEMISKISIKYTF